MEAPESAAAVHLFFAPIKKQRVKLLLEKATELGVSRLSPVITQNTNEKWAAAADDDEDGGSFGRILVESAEQCERLSVPILAAPTPLSSLLSSFPQSHPPQTHLLVCRERCADATPLLSSLGGAAGGGVAALPPVCLLVGPEGGFTDNELRDMASRPFVRFVSLGENVLRAETAALAALAITTAWLQD